MSIGDSLRNMTSEIMKFLNTVGKQATAFTRIKRNIDRERSVTRRMINKTIHSLRNPYHIKKMSHTHPGIGFQIYINYSASVHCAFLHLGL